MHILEVDDVLVESPDEQVVAAVAEAEAIVRELANPTDERQVIDA